MWTTITIISLSINVIIALYLLVSDIKLKQKNKKDRDRGGFVWVDDIEKYRESIQAPVKEQEAKKPVFTQTGELLHSFNEMYERKNFKFIPLINYLGDCVRSMYWGNTPLEHFARLIKDNKTKFPCIRKEQNDLLRVFLVEIIDGQREPEDLIKLCRNLMLADDFEEALKDTDHRM